MFSCFGGLHGIGTNLDCESENQFSSDSDTAQLVSNKMYFKEVRYIKKPKFNSSGGGGTRKLDTVDIEEDPVNYGMLVPDQKLNMVLSKVNIVLGSIQ